MNRIIKVTVYLGLFFAVLLSGCQIAGTDNTSDANIEALEGVFAKTHLSEVESEEAAKAAPKAAVPFYGGDGYDGIFDGTIAIPTASPVSVANYPEYGQTSVYSITETGTSYVYRVSVTTSYSSWSVRETQEEVYYIRDAGTSGIYDKDDPVLAADLSTANTLYRETMRTVFSSSFGGSDSIRYETIEDDSFMSSAFLLAALDAGSMNYETAAAARPNLDDNATWSSKVSYLEEQSGTDSVVSALLGFSISATYTIAGVRYYTELPDTDLLGYDQSNTTLWLEETRRSSDDALVSTSVTREKYYINTTSGARSSKTVKSKTLLYDSKGKKRMYLDKDGSSLASLSYY